MDSDDPSLGKGILWTGVSVGHRLLSSIHQSISELRSLNTGELGKSRQKKVGTISSDRYGKNPNLAAPGIQSTGERGFCKTTIDSVNLGISPINLNNLGEFLFTEVKTFVANRPE